MISKNCVTIFQSNKDMWVTSNPYIGFRLGKLVTEEYIQMGSRSVSPMAGAISRPGSLSLGSPAIQTVVTTTVVNQQNGQTYSISNFTTAPNHQVSKIDLTQQVFLPRSCKTMHYSDYLKNLAKIFLF